MKTMIRNACRVFSEYFDEETHMPPLLNVAWSLGRYDQDELDEALGEKMASMLRGESYEEDKLEALAAFRNKPIPNSTTELLIILAWREVQK